jgi:hypothetical protein
LHCGGPTVQAVRSLGQRQIFFLGENLQDRFEGPISPGFLERDVVQVIDYPTRGPTRI